jgi:CRP/FNR family transcriptional regulator
MHLASTNALATQTNKSTHTSIELSMLSTMMPEIFPPVLTPTAGWRSRGNLQSNLTDICGLLNIAEPTNSNCKDILFQHVHYKTGKRIHLIGQHFDTLFIVNSGFLKTIVIDECGNEQVLGFPMKGDLLGIDAIHSKQHTTEVVALSDCDLILIPYKTFSALGRAYAELEHAMLGFMSRELVREQMIICMLSALGAEAKVARFLVSLGKRFSQLGYSGKVYNLRMTRLEIANYLGLAIETVSRTLSAFHELGLIVVYQRQIRIVDAESLATLRRLPPTKQHANTTAVCAPIKKVLEIKIASKLSSPIKKCLTKKSFGELKGVYMNVK